MATNITFADHVESRPGAAIDVFVPNREAPSSGVSWSAVIGGAFVAAAFYLILLALGAGLGLSAVSPWSNVGLSRSTVGTAAIIWLIVIEIVASALGGYLTGRLRTKWAQIHTDEVYFRDTANGFLAWAVALVISVAFLASGAATMVGNGAQLGEAAGGIDPNAYFVDTLLRGSANKTPAVEAEAAGILVHGLAQNEMPAADQAYLARLTAAQTGITMPDAEKRVSDVVTEARAVEDEARKVTAHLLLWLFLAMAMGAFSASYAATIGGRQRDHVRAV